MMQPNNLLKIAHGLFGISVIAAGIAALVFFLEGDAIWGLAGTQWLLISTTLGIFAANMHLCKKCCGSGKCE